MASRRGDEAIAFLNEIVSSAKDTAESAHWQQYHQDFESQNGGFSFQGLRGFGGFAPRTNLQGVFHFLMLLPFRYLARKLPSFRILMGHLQEIARRQNRTVDLDMFRQACTLAQIENDVPHLEDGPVKWMVIGDGYGVFTALLLMRNPKAQVILVNLDKTLLVDLAFLRQTFGDEYDRMTRLVTSCEQLRVAVAGFDDTTIGPSAGPSIIAVRAQHRDILVETPVDVVVNVVSMQEMRLEDIAGYFDVIRSAAIDGGTHFYCCNRESKVLPDGTVVSFDDYPWAPKDSVLLDELTPWHQWCYSGNPPFFRRYDGPIRHRLIRVAPARS